MGSSEAQVRAYTRGDVRRDRTRAIIILIQKCVNSCCEKPKNFQPKLSKYCNLDVWLFD